MKKYVVFLFVAAITACKVKKDVAYQIPLNGLKNNWSINHEIQFSQSQNDTTKWNDSMFVADRANIKLLYNEPINPAAFPVAKYNTPGVFANGLETSVQGKRLFVFSYGIHNINKDTSQVKPTYDIFFNVIVLIDKTFDLQKEYKKIANLIVSRNHPHYVAEGRFGTNEGNVDWSGFLTANGDSYAIINMRIFNLKAGNTILIAPQKDRTFRSLQLQTPPLSSKIIKEYFQELKNNKKVSDFLSASGNID